LKTLKTHDELSIRPYHWWSNFLGYLRTQVPLGLVTGEYVEEQVSNYNCIFVNLKAGQAFTGYTMIFETEEDATAFVLKWS